MSKVDIRLEDLSVTIGQHPILSQVDLLVKSRSFTGIIGPNGSGKTTLLKAVYRVLNHYSGTVYLDDVDLKTIPLKTSAQSMGVIAQHNDYPFDFFVWELVAMGRNPYKKMFERDNANDVAIIANALETVGLVGFENRGYASLSGGEKQRAILARALAQQTQCLIMDEPTNHLDIKYQYELMRLVKALDMIVFASIHDLNIAALYCDWIYLIDGGVICAQGRPEQVLTPENILAHFKIQSEVLEDKSGNIRIFFHP